MEPRGEQRDDLRMAVLDSHLIAASGAKFDGRPPSPEELRVRFDLPDDDEEPS